MERRDFFKNSLMLSAATFPTLYFPKQDKPTLEEVRQLREGLLFSIGALNP